MNSVIPSRTPRTTASNMDCRLIPRYLGAELPFRGRLSIFGMPNPQIAIRRPTVHA